MEAHGDSQSHDVPETGDISPRTLSCENISCTRKGKVILENVHFLAAPGELQVILGPSGAGKTTLLHIMLKRLTKNVQGVVKYGGRIVKSRKELKGFCAWVTLDRRLLPYLTVQETLMYSLRLRSIGQNISKIRMQQKVEEIICLLGLNSCRDIYIGGDWIKGVSTGERTRVILGIELLSNPSVLILDEPLSGLDSHFAYEIIVLLKKIAHSGRTVILTIHQPSSRVWETLDKAMILAEGKVAYYGLAREMKSYFSNMGFSCPKNHNPIEFVMSLITTKNLGSSLDSEFYKSDLKDNNPNSVKKICPAEYEPNEKELQDGSELVPRVHGFAEKESGKNNKAVDCLTPNPCYFTEKYESSEISKNLLKKIKEISVVTKEERNDVTLISTAKKNVAHAITEVPTLCGRSFKNSIRNPVLALVMVLIHLTQGALTGGIFWQISKQAPSGEDLNVATKGFMNNQWTQLFINGIDGEQPFLDALEKGVDGNGSHPFLSAAQVSPKKLIKTHRVIVCALQYLEKYFLKPLGYPDFGVRLINPDGPLFPSNVTPEDKSFSLLQLDAGQAYSDLLGLVQHLDFLILRQNWSGFILENRTMDTTQRVLFWDGFGRRVIPPTTDPYFKCMGFPYSALLETSPLSKFIRKLEEVDADNVFQLINDTFGSKHKELGLITVQNIGTFCAKHKKYIAERFSNVYNKTTKFGDAIVSAVSVTHCIIGATFFLVSNLGFACYDALLKFPQEKKFLGQEISSGLCGCGSYFIAQNLADLPFQLISSLLMSTIFLLMMGNTETLGQFFLSLLICFLMTFSSYGVGYFISAISSTMEISVVIAPILLVIWLVISGYFIADAEIPKWIHWFSNTSIYKWSFMSLVENRFPVGGNFGIVPNSVALSIARIENPNLTLHVLWLFLLGILYRFITYIVLLVNLRKNF